MWFLHVAVVFITIRSRPTDPLSAIDDYFQHVRALSVCTVCSAMTDRCGRLQVLHGSEPLKRAERYVLLSEAGPGSDVHVDNLFRFPIHL